MYHSAVLVVLLLAASKGKFSDGSSQQLLYLHFCPKPIASSNLLADTALDVILSTTRSSLDPISIEDRKYKVKVNFLFSLHVGSISFSNTSITGLTNLSRVTETDLGIEEDGGYSGTVGLQVNDVKLKSEINPKFGRILDIGMGPLPIVVTIGTFRIDFTIVTDSWGLSPQVKELKITKMDDIKVDIEYPGKNLLEPFSYVADRLLTDAVVGLVKERLRKRLEKKIKTKMNESLNQYNFFG